MCDWWRHQAPWTWLTLAGLVALTAIDLWRKHGPEVDSVIVGVAPNFVAVVVLSFGAMMARWPHKQLHTTQRHRRVNRYFQRTLSVVLLGLTGWEFMQLIGQLTFDWLDILATGIGGLFVIWLFHLSVRKFWLQPPE